MWWKKEYRMWWSTWNLWKDKGSSEQLKNVESRMVYTNHDKLVLSTVPALLGMAKDYKLTLHGVCLLYVALIVVGIDRSTPEWIASTYFKNIAHWMNFKKVGIPDPIRSLRNATRLRFGRRLFLYYSWSFGDVGIRLWWGKSSEEYWCHQPDQAPQEDGSPKAGCSLQGQDASIDRSWVLKGAENCTESQQE